MHLGSDWKGWGGGCPRLPVDEGAGLDEGVGGVYFFFLLVQPLFCT